MSDPTIEKLEQTIALLQATNDRLDQIETAIAQLTKPAPKWLSKKDFAALSGKSPATLDRWRKNPDMGLIEGIHWQKVGGEIEFNTEVMTHWRDNLRSPAIHSDWLRDRAASMKKPGRKRSA